MKISLERTASMMRDFTPLDAMPFRLDMQIFVRLLECLATTTITAGQRYNIAVSLLKPGSSEGSTCD
ncbi:hypothetical protein BK662_20885 [Pseudomonas frederiksbergensis]|uniref:Uncharacterized protein n=2 Tax=Pseudomonas frederiksbergensis TaxID=104087 RepID=A0A423HKE0_9PSED|nr:hypothetical protein BK662_20885 [Pseudomonas frederiksbergensis]